MRTVSLKFRGREITNPTARKVVGTLFIVLIPLWVAIAVVGLVLAIIIGVVSAPVHFILRACGRQGFVTRTRTSVAYNVGRDGFRKA